MSVYVYFRIARFSRRFMWFGRNLFIIFRWLLLRCTLTFSDSGLTAFWKRNTKAKIRAPSKRIKKKMYLEVNNFKWGIDGSKQNKNKQYLKMIMLYICNSLTLHLDGRPSHYTLCTWRKFLVYFAHISSRQRFSITCWQIYY